ncbi:MAG: hypothetical protein WD847_13625 [Pirellulales bacterium]|jgi:hypothetical protein
MSRQGCFGVLVALALLAGPASAHDRWGFSIESYGPPAYYYEPPVVYYAPPPPPIYRPYGYYGPRRHYYHPPGRHYHSRRHYDRPAVSLWFGF